MNHGAQPETATRAHLPRLIAWEVTRSCLLNCKHCRAAAGPGAYSDELTLAECRALLSSLRVLIGALRGAGAQAPAQPVAGAVLASIRGRLDEVPRDRP